MLHNLAEALVSTQSRRIVLNFLVQPETVALVFVIRQIPMLLLFYVVLSMQEQHTIKECMNANEYGIKTLTDLLVVQMVQNTKHLWQIVI